MGVQATLTTSLCREGQLWGLIACHHGTPRRVLGTIRQIADWLGQDLITEIALSEEISRRRDETHRQECRQRIVSAMRQGTRLAALLKGPQLSDLLGAIGADGVALMSGTEVTTGGVTPAPQRILDLVARLSTEHAEDPSPLFATDCLSEHLAGTDDLAATAAGLVLIPLDEEQTIKLIGFRGEYVRTVTWGGDPDKAVAPAPNVRLSPRQSFAAWTQMVRLRSRRWDPDELESIRRLGTLIDIEWRKVAEEALREANRRKDEFLAMLGHELRNPLAPIRHVADVLTLDPTLERVPWAADILTRQVSHLVRLVDDLLDVARINRGKMVLHRQRFDLREAVERAMEQALPLLDTHAQRLDAALAPMLVTVDGDPDRLTQVIVNLLGNAAKFSPPDRTIFLTLDTEQGAARIQVCDQGIGIATSLLPQLFTPFTQGEQPLDRPHGGLGLGLALVKGLVELHGGQVQATSPGPGSGSTFTVHLPLAQVTPAAAASHPDGHMIRRVVLVVDDDRDVAAACAMLLSCLDQEVHTAHDGVTALDLVERLQPELILLDIGLPDMNGYEVTRRLRTTAAGRAARLVALTGYGQEDDRQRAFAAGFDEHLCKPVDVKTLIALMERCP
jgi:light-regulated signal transduction histidine kinase (bacteriophytochrome)/CheY-like chemotaxis protein